MPSKSIPPQPSLPLSWNLQNLVFDLLAEFAFLSRSFAQPGLHANLKSLLWSLPIISQALLTALEDTSLASLRITRSLSIHTNETLALVSPDPALSKPHH